MNGSPESHELGRSSEVRTPRFAHKSYRDAETQLLDVEDWTIAYSMLPEIQGDNEEAAKNRLTHMLAACAGGINCLDDVLGFVQSLPEQVLQRMFNAMKSWPVPSQERGSWTLLPEQRKKGRVFDVRTTEKVTCKDWVSLLLALLCNPLIALVLFEVFRDYGTRFPSDWTSGNRIRTWLCHMLGAYKVGLMHSALAHEAARFARMHDNMIVQSAQGIVKAPVPTDMTGYYKGP